MLRKGFTQKKKQRKEETEKEKERERDSRAELAESNAERSQIKAKTRPGEARRCFPHGFCDFSAGAQEGAAWSLRGRGGCIDPWSRPLDDFNCTLAAVVFLAPPPPPPPRKRITIAKRRGRGPAMKFIERGKYQEIPSVTCVHRSPPSPPPSPLRPLLSCSLN